MSSKIDTSMSMGGYNFRQNFIEENSDLNFEKVLLKFQEFMKKEYSERDEKFLEQNGRLIFLAFIKPIINGLGFDFKEVQISEEKRLDVVITYLNKIYVVELKIWQGPSLHDKGIRQLSDYLEIMSLQKGYLIIYDFTKKGKKQWKREDIKTEGKNIFAIWI